MFRIVIADPDELVSLRMKGLFTRATGLEVVGTAQDGPGALELVRRLSPDVVLVVLAVPPLGGVALIETIKYVAPRTQVVVLAADVRDATELGHLHAEVLGVLTKDGSAKYLSATGSGSTRRSTFELVH